MSRLLFAVLIFSACGNDDGPDNVDPVTLSGAAQKGPFILGAQVQVNVLDTTGNPTGTVFNTSTTSEKGEFTVIVDPSVVDLTTNGFYYNEATWALSGAAISMRALTEISAGGPQEAYVNVFTHVTARRALALYQGGTALGDAIAAAEVEILPAFRHLVTPTSLGAGSTLNLLGGTDESNAYLLAVSCVISQTALDASNGTDNDAQVQQLINNLASDLESDGAIAEPLIVQIADAVVDPHECVASLQQRLDDIGDTTTVLPDPQLVFDLDLDHIANASDPDADGNGVDAVDDPVVSAAAATGRLVVVTGTSMQAWRLVGPYQTSSRIAYDPAIVSDGDTGVTLTDVEQVIGLDGSIALRRSDGTVHRVLADGGTQPVAGVTGAVALGSTVDGQLIIIDSNGDVTLNGTTPLAMAAAVRVAGREPNFVYLDDTGAVRVVESGTPTDILGLASLTIVDVAADFYAASVDSYLALTDTGALYRFSADAPTAVEDTLITGVTAVHVEAGRIFAVTPTGVWNLVGGGAPGSPTQVTDAVGLTSFHGPLAWGQSGQQFYLAIDAAGALQVIEYHDDLTVGKRVRAMYVPR